MNPIDQVINQIRCINSSITKQLKVNRVNSLSFWYKDLCQNPEGVFNNVVSKLADMEYEVKTEYNGPNMFENRNGTNIHTTLMNKIESRL